LAALRAAREKRKQEVGTLPAANPTAADTSGLSTVDATKSAAERLANRRLQAAQSTTPAIGARTTGANGPPVATNSTPNPTPGPVLNSPTNPQGIANRSPSVNGQTVNSPPGNPAQSGAGAAAGRNLPSRVSGAAPPNPSINQNQGNMIRRPSIVVIEKEKKTDYWKDVERTVAEQGAKISGDDLNQVISRAMSLGIVGDKKQRESLSGPQSNELLMNLKQSLEQKIVELSGGKQINFDALASNNSTMMDKILGLEKALSTLESRKSQEEEEEKKRVQNKISELERSLRALEAQKTQQREQSRRTMKLEIANLKK
jgi:hypothetical protein